ncbi:DUF58 domain-containing protein [Thiofaba sp. EF100]|uniref:DUF58 domain-containing protein n=1 Tax=Thiofaba sp. EF100 TaxID=3121274 RepID=UPI0032215DB0
MRFPPLERWLHRHQARGDLHAPLLDDATLAEIAALTTSLPEPVRLSPRLQRGEQASPYQGPGLDFSDLRPYQPGDDVRRIDWRVSARLQKPFVRVYAETRQAVTWVVLDRGPSMRFGTRARLKAAQAARLAALVLGGAGRALDALALTLLDGDAYTTQPPRSGRAPLHAALEALRTACPPPQDTAPSRWSEVLAELELTLPHGARLWLISDCLGLTREDEALLERLAARAELTLCPIEDASERALPPLGRVHLQTAAGTVELDTASHALRTAYAEARATRLKHLEALAGRLRARLLPVGADEELAVIATRLAGGA